MALVTTAQSIRYMPAGPAAGTGDLDSLNRVLADLCARGIPKDGAALALRRHVEEGARDLSGEAFSRFMDQLYDRITSLLESNDVSENLGALRAIDELIDVAIEENAVNVSKIATYMRTAFEAKREPETLVVASKVLGHLARAGGAMTADEVERLVKIALDWLGGERIEYRRLAAVLILKEMAENASTVFNVHVPEFVEAIWVALRDPKLNIRERAVEALRACLWVIEKRETRWRVQWLTLNRSPSSPVGILNSCFFLVIRFENGYCKITASVAIRRYCVNFCIKLVWCSCFGVDIVKSVECQSYTMVISGAYYFFFQDFCSESFSANLTLEQYLLPDVDGSWGTAEVGSMILFQPALDCHVKYYTLATDKNTGEFMMSRYREVAEIVLRYLEHRDRLVRLSITSLLPRIAYFLRDRFVTNYLTICMKHIFHVLKLPAEAASGFIALGEMSGALDGELFNYLPTITSHLRDAIAPRRGQPSMEALACVGNLAKAMGPSMEPHVRSLLDSMFSIGLSSTLVEALEHITASIPTLLPTIQERLLDCISGVFSRNQEVQSRPSNAITRTASSVAMLQVSELYGSALVQLALQTLARFNFKDRDLLEFARELVVPYLEDDDGGTRKDAALCCCKLMENSLFGVLSVQFTSHRKTRSGGRRRRLIEEIVEKLLIAAVADADVAVRLSIFSSLHETGGFDDYLAQADCLTAMFAALNDEDFAVREIAISLAGRLSAKNPAYVLPALRRHLIQLLTYLKQSADNKCREESAKLLGCLIRNCERLILPYISPIHKALITKLNEGTGVSVNNGIITGVLVTVGDLTRVGGFAMRQYIPELMPLIVEALLDSAAAMKREVAVTTLGQVVQSTGYVITPYNEYPQLLGLLLKLLNGELAWSTRREVLKVLGIMGALDPHVHKRNQLNLPGSHGEVTRAACDPSQHTRSSMDEVPVDLWPSFATSEDYYSTVAISCLMRIFRDSSLSSYHQKVVGSLIFIFKAMNLGCVPYLPKVLPELLHTVRSCDDNNLKEYITWKLGTLVSIVRQHIRKYLPDLFSLISELWSSFNLPAANRPVHGSPVLHLLEQLCLALNDEFRTHLPFILPFCIQVLSDAERFKDTYVVDILHTLEVFGGTLDDHMHLLLPALIRIFKLDASVEVRRAAIRTLTKLIPRVQVSGHISALVHHLKLVLDGNNDELRKDAVDALCCLGHAFGEDFTIFIPSIHKLLSKHCMRHKDFEEIEDRIRRRAPLILVTVAQEQTCEFPGEVISDPLNDTEDPESRVNEGRIRSAGEASQRSTREDWAEWMRHFSIELLKESPAPALRTCAKLAQLQPFVGRELFAVGFVSCWTELSEPCRRQLVRSLEMAFSSPNIPPEILATLLNLAEFMEHDERPLPIDIRLLGALAEKCRAFAKALHYKEMEFEGACSNMMDGNPVAVVEALIHINNQLHQHEAAVGILTYSQQHLSVQLKESWYEKLQRWDDALKAYTVKASQVSSRHLILEATLGQMRCLAALARWEELNNLCKEYWAPAEPAARLEMAPMAASAAWNMGEWDQMAEYVYRLDDGDENKLGVLGNTAATGDGSSIGTFFRAVLLVRRGKYDEAREYVERARKCLCTEVAALVLESYERAYSNMVRVQQLSELEEVIDYCTLPAENPVSEGRRALIRNMWRERIRGAKRQVEVWQALLSVRSLVLPPTEDVETWIKFASLCRKSGRINQARSTLTEVLQFDPESTPETERYLGDPQVILAYLKYQWSLGEDHRRKEAFARLKDLAVDFPRMPGFQQSMQSGLMGTSKILNALRNATHCATTWAKAWHNWALFNTAVMSHYTLRGHPSVAGQFVVSAVTGYFHSIACGAHAKGVDDSLQDILRLLTLWFNHGATSEVQVALQRGFSLVNINTWLVVLPQIIARIHSNNRAVRELIQALLVRIGQSHPQALMYPLLVACKSISTLRKEAAQEVVDQVRQHSGVLVDEAQLVSTELVRVAILLLEMWHEGLEEASRLYFGERNVEAMMTVLEPLHQMLEECAMRNNNTINERSFIQQYRRELLDAHASCIRYRRTGKDAELTQSMSPELLLCRDLKLAVPGTYKPDSHVVTIGSFAPQLTVITSKQRPRKLTIHGSDGEEYAFLLKGHEDLRQDERVMQLFGLVNTLLANSRKTAEKDLSIQRYEVIPLSPNSGLIEWVPNCDTLHHLIREYRDARKISLNHEHRLMIGFASDYDRLPVISKLEVFEYALENTEGNDLSRVLWLKSRTSEIWLDRRTNYTRSLAVMSMVGYLLGLGDRHPSNLMLHRYSGKILHIDFGDCFEASMNREKFPEKVPFRLTRMLVKAMEVSGIEGNFRSTCESVMQVLRTNKDSVMAMMEAFVHDPLINWRLFNFNEVPEVPTLAQPTANGEDSSPTIEMIQPQRVVRERELLEAVNQLGDANEVLNERAVVVMARMSNKLTGRDFSSFSSSSVQSYLDQQSSLVPGDAAHEAEHGLSVKVQVQKLILQATSHENLCQNYVGWCPFW
ncbi:serine/threonine protein kinase mTOR [Striga asiatica]|uniref:non-specific serine/threonine protein kinase n=1 Tax=Striga asiatica TaxID=4170 RepID=A0A5A7QB11_STRAF|nr:serine/threonine protein kinase mTOR [Striga asiatica]